MTSRKKLSTVVALVLGWLVSLLWGAVWFRIISVPGFVLLTLALATLPWHKRKRAVIAVWLFFIVSTVVPLDIRHSHRPITQRIVPYIVGYPSDETVEKAKRGEVYLHGCISTGTEPKWVVLW